MGCSVYGVERSGVECLRSGVECLESGVECTPRKKIELLKWVQWGRLGLFYRGGGDTLPHQVGYRVECPPSSILHQPPGSSLFVKISNP